MGDQRSELEPFIGVNALGCEQKHQTRLCDEAAPKDENSMIYFKGGDYIDFLLIVTSSIIASIHPLES